MRQSYFTPAVFSFLKELEENNNKQWWEENKDRYIEVIREPAILTRELGTCQSAANGKRTKNHRKSGPRSVSRRDPQKGYPQKGYPHRLQLHLRWGLTVR